MRQMTPSEAIDEIEARIEGNGVAFPASACIQIVRDYLVSSNQKISELETRIIELMSRQA